MASSPNIRIPLEDHEEAEKIALIISANKQKLTSKNAVMKKAIKIGLEILREENGTDEKKTRTDK